MPFRIMLIAVVITAVLAAIFAFRERSREMFMGALAILLAGAAVVLLLIVFVR